MPLYAAGGAVALVVTAFLLIYFVIFPTSSPSPFRLSTVPTSGTGTTSASTAATGTGPGSLAGVWKVADGSQAGYRVREKLAFLPAQSDAVGRTSQITGSATFTDAAGAVTVSAASFESTRSP